MMFHVGKFSVKIWTDDWWKACPRPIYEVLGNPPEHTWMWLFISISW